MLSFIVPAHNEEACLGRTLEAIHDAARATGQPYEIIVANDASTDATVEIAAKHQATVVSVQHRQIAATRNSGARAARGERLFFVDADTVVNQRALGAALRVMDHGAVGGGAAVWFDGELPLYFRLVTVFAGLLCLVFGFTGGAFLFCTREAFAAVDGFNEKFFCSEESFFIMGLKGRGRFVIIGPRVLTSGRRLRTTSGLQVMALCARVMVAPFKTVTRRAAVEKIWYNSNRAGDDKMSRTLAARFSNGIALVVTLILCSAPVWFFIPWAATPLGTPWGKVRFVCTFVLAHAGLSLWLFAAFLVWALAANLRRWHWSLESLKIAAIIAFCVWQGWDCTRGVLWAWPTLIKMLNAEYFRIWPLAWLAGP